MFTVRDTNCKSRSYDSYLDSHMFKHEYHNNTFKKSGCCCLLTFDEKIAGGVRCRTVAIKIQNGRKQEGLFFVGVNVEV